MSMWKLAGTAGGAVRKSVKAKECKIRAIQNLYLEKVPE